MEVYDSERTINEFPFFFLEQCNLVSLDCTSGEHTETIGRVVECDG
jgi:hypothetical protein